GHQRDQGLGDEGRDHLDVVDPSLNQRHQYVDTGIDDLGVLLQHLGKGRDHFLGDYPSDLLDRLGDTSHELLKELHPLLDSGRKLVLNGVHEGRDDLVTDGIHHVREGLNEALDQGEEELNPKSGKLGEDLNHGQDDDRDQSEDGGLKLGKGLDQPGDDAQDRKSTRLNSSHVKISYAVY